ncbi:MAG: ROK family protein [Anaerolineae bacterium]|nr:ROK family protein [Anaerolineae bacterium]
MILLGIDVGGTGIKGAPVDTDKGELLQERFRVLTPQPADPENVGNAVAEVARHFDWKERIGVGFPAAIARGTKMRTAANVDPSWIDTDGKVLFEAKTNCKVTLLNDADAAGIAELVFGAGRHHTLGLIFMITIGTGIGTAMFLDGKLVPNTELGHIEIRGKDAEARASERTRLEKDLSWDKWAKRVNEYLVKMEKLFWPDMFIIGGGVSKHFDRFSPYLEVKARVVPAELGNEAGIVGAAMAAVPHNPYYLDQSAIT